MSDEFFGSMCNFSISVYRCVFILFREYIYSVLPDKTDTYYFLAEVHSLWYFSGIINCDLCSVAIYTGSPVLTDTYIVLVEVLPICNFSFTINRDLCS